MSAAEQTSVFGIRSAVADDTVFSGKVGFGLLFTKRPQVPRPSRQASELQLRLVDGG